MILVDIEFPANGQKYDFRLDENAYIANIIDEIGEIMFYGEESNSQNIKDLLLCDYTHYRILSPTLTLKQCGIGSGARLTLL